jgi:hypothetical protein
MLITLIAMQGVWLALREYRQRQSVRERMRHAAPGNTQPDLDPVPPFWPALAARYRKELTMAGNRRARTRKAVERLNMASQRKTRSGPRRG